MQRSPLARRVRRALLGGVTVLAVGVVASTFELPIDVGRPARAGRAMLAASLSPTPPPAATAAAAAEDAEGEPAAEPAGKPATCFPAPTTPIPSMVASIFRCRLTEAGVPPDQVEVITAEAVTIAACESEFDPAAVVFDGRYMHVPHPATGSFHSAAGIFQFIREHADRWIAGGYANVTDPVANIDAAARLYLHNARRGYPGWSDWACAAANDGFRAVSVLPGWPGGPARLPEWAFTY